MTVLLDSVSAELLKQKEKLEAEAADLEARLREVNDVRERIAAALTALCGKAGTKRSKATAKHPSTGVNKGWMIATLTELLHDNDGIELSELKDLALSRVRDQGLPLSGAALAFKHAVQDQQFHDELRRRGLIA